MHPICLHHISSLLKRKNTQLLICPSAFLSLALARSPAFYFFFALSSLSRNHQRNKTFSPHHPQTDSSSKQDQKHSLLRNYLPELDVKQTNRKRRWWTLHCRHLCNRTQSCTVAPQRASSLIHHNRGQIQEACCHYVTVICKTSAFIITRGMDSLKGPVAGF